MLGFIEPTEKRYADELSALEKEGVVFYRGSQKDVRPFIARSHCLIHPSVYGEGMSNVLLENASSGRPIITTDNPGCRETVNDGITGFIYPGGDVDALVRIIKTFVHETTNEERKQMGLEGRRKVENEFSREVVIEAYLEKIRELVEC
jgi:galacturonosyltransferase